MTVLVGFLCDGGVVIGADSAATFTQGPHPTIEQPTQKIQVVGESVVLATSGQVGLSQRFANVVEKQWDDRLFSSTTAKDIYAVAKQICADTLDDFVSTRVNVNPLPLGALLAFPFKKDAFLCEFAHDNFQPEFKNEKLWYVSMGSGQQIADPFLGLMRRCFCPDHPPSLKEGIFIVAWTLDHTIRLNPGGIAGPPQIAVLEEGMPGCTARMLDQDELDEHVNNVEDAHEYLSAYRDILAGKVEQSPPPEPGQ